MFKNINHYNNKQARTKEQTKSKDKKKTEPMFENDIQSVRKQKEKRTHANNTIRTRKSNIFYSYIVFLYEITNGKLTCTILPVH